MGSYRFLALFSCCASLLSTTLFPNCLIAETSDCGSDLMNDLTIVGYWNARINEKFPVTFNHLLQGGYFSMPSARMGKEGEIGVGYGYIPPYTHYNLRLQLVDFLELSGCYRIFKGVDDEVLTRWGFGDFSDKGVNLKCALFSPEDSYYQLPGLAIGLEDFIGTSAFQSRYIVLTQVFFKQNLEVSVGYGSCRMRKWFGGLLWMPFRQSNYSYLQNLALVVEYDAIPYHHSCIEPHPRGRIKRTPWHFGLKYRLWGNVDLSVAYIRGDKLAFTVSTFYNFGTSKGIIPKFQDILPYRSPINIEPLGLIRPADAMVHELGYAMRAQGLELLAAWLSDEEGELVLRLSITNYVYRNEYDVRTRMIPILAALVPSNIDKTIVIMDVISMPIQEIHYNMQYVHLYTNQEMGRYELDVLTPLREVSAINYYNTRQIFKRDLELWNLELMPKTHTLFGSARGKFKYALGLTASLNGFILNDCYYSINLGWCPISNLSSIGDIDLLNPSQIINVRTDGINYYKSRSITLDEAYVEKIFNWGKGVYTRLSVGFFEQAYGGVGFEWLYYPVQSSWAVGMEGALLKRRGLHGLDFTDRIRKLRGCKPHYVYFLGSQYFFNIYYDWRCTGLLFKFSVGQFLAKDLGVRTEVSRYFYSGLQVGFWYTYTNGHDVINGKDYRDTGLFFTVPLDIFYTQTSRTRWGYGMSSWLRDVGATAYTGRSLYDLISQERY